MQLIQSNFPFFFTRKDCLICESILVGAEFLTSSISISGISDLQGDVRPFMLKYNFYAVNFMTMGKVENNR